MVSKKRHTKQQRREIILEAALQCFSEKGYTKTTTKEIASQAGVSEALLYKHFSSKASLYEALGKFCTTEGQQAFVRLFQQPNTPFSFIASVYLMMYLITFASPPKRRFKHFSHRLFVCSILDNGELIREFHREQIKPWVKYLYRKLVELKKQNAITNVPPSKHLLWFSYFISSTMTIFDLSDNLVSWEGDPTEVFHDSVQFALRGIGLKEEIIQENFRPKDLENYINRFF